jgi:hypothetical protein
MIVELYSTQGCRLCDEALALLVDLRKEFLFEIKHTVLDDGHPKFAEWHIAVPVVVIDGKREFKGKIADADLRGAIRELKPPTAGYYAGKFLEAVGFLAVAVGFMYGCAGDMYTDLYFFLGGIAIFTAGRVLERRALKRPTTPSDTLTPAT